MNNILQLIEHLLSTTQQQFSDNYITLDENPTLQSPIYNILKDNCPRNGRFLTSEDIILALRKELSKSNNTNII